MLKKQFYPVEPPNRKEKLLHAIFGDSKGILMKGENQIIAFRQKIGQILYSLLNRKILNYKQCALFVALFIDDADLSAREIALAYRASEQELGETERFVIKQLQEDEVRKEFLEFVFNKPTDDPSDASWFPGPRRQQHTSGNGFGHKHRANTNFYNP